MFLTKIDELGNECKVINKSDYYIISVRGIKITINDKFILFAG